MTDDVLGYKSDLKHTSTTKARVEDREKKAIEGLRSVEDELWVVKEEFQATREELCTKAAVLDRAFREASKAESSVEWLAEECSTLLGDLQRLEVVISQRDGVIVELRDEACTLLASVWLAFRRRDAKAFPGLDFNLQVPKEEETEESVSKDEADLEVFISIPFPREAEALVEVGSSPSTTGALPSDLQGSAARTTEAIRSSPSNT